MRKAGAVAWRELRLVIELSPTASAWLGLPARDAAGRFTAPCLPAGLPRRIRIHRSDADHDAATPPQSAPSSRRRRTP